MNNYSYVLCSDIDDPKPVIIPPKDPPGGGLPAGGEPGQYLVIDDDGNPTWAAGGGGGGPTLYPSTGQSTTGGMTQKAITDNLNLKAPQTALDALSTTVGTKASQDDLDALETTVGGKADQSDVDSLSGIVTSLSGDVESVSIKVDNLEPIVDGKADKSYVNSELAKKQNLLVAGQNITLTPDATTGNVTISATGGGDTFVAEYGVTTSQELLAYLDSTKEPFAPILVKRGNSYYTAVVSSPGTDRVNLSTFGTISGEGYLFNYTVTGSNWSASNIGFQTKLVSGTNIKTINNQSLLGPGNIDIQGGSGTDEILFIHVNEADFTPTTTAGVDSQVLTSPYTVAELIENAALEQPKELILRIETVSGDKSDYLDVPLSVQGESGYFGGQLFLYEATGDATGVYVYNIELSGTDTVLTRTVKVFDKYAQVGVETVTNPDQSSTVVGAVYDGTNDIRMYVNKDAQGQLGDTLNVQLGTQVIPVPLSASGITVDDALSKTSLNPVQNRVLYGIFESLRQIMEAMQNRIVALETKLADFEETRLQMTDGTDTVDKVVLTKPYVAPTPPVTNMFDLEHLGAYDANGNLLGKLEYSDSDATPISAAWESYGLSVSGVYVDKILALYPTAKGVVLKDVQQMGQIYGATSGALDWIVVAGVDTIYLESIPVDNPLVDGDVTDAVGTFYANERIDLTAAPWGQTSMTINTTGTPLPWA